MARLTASTLLAVCLLLAAPFAGSSSAQAYEHVAWIAPAVIVATLIFIFTMRAAMILFDIRLYTFGRREAETGSAEPVAGTERAAGEKVSAEARTEGPVRSLRTACSD